MMTEEEILARVAAEAIAKTKLGPISTLGATTARRRGNGWQCPARPRERPLHASEGGGDLPSH
jgi:hypothetical protein